MRLTKVIFLLLSLSPVYGINVNYSFVNPNFPNPGTIGSQATFDVQSILVSTTASTIKVTINTDYQNGNLNPFLLNGTSCTPANGSKCLQIADFFFTNPSLVDQYGVAIEPHGDVANPASALVNNTSVYNVTGGATLTSSQIFAATSGLIFRTNQNVWINPATATHNNVSGDTVTPVSTPVPPNPGANGTNAAIYTLMFTVNLPTPATDALYQLVTSGKFGVYFASADCANDYYAAVAPEPGTFLLLGAGLAAIGFAAKRARNARRA